MEKNKGRAIALLPIGVFLVIFLGAGIVTGDFYTMPAIVAFLIALLVAFLQNKNLSFGEKLKVISKGVGDENIITMSLIFLCAGGFFRSSYGSRGSRQYGEFWIIHSAFKCCGSGIICNRMLYFRVNGNIHGDDCGISADCGWN